MSKLTTPIALQASGINASLGEAHILKDIDLVLPAGRWTSIVGPNGAGKSTLLKVLANLLPHTGSISLVGKPVASLPTKQRAQQLAWLGQNEVTGDDLTVWDVAMLGRLPHQTWLTAPSAADHAAVAQALRATQAWDWRGRTLGQLSGGERQRVLLARALAGAARVLLGEDPLPTRAPPHQADWLHMVRGLIAEGKTVVSVLHEISMALHADDMLIMAAGRMTHQGACGDVATHRALESVFDDRIAIHALGNQWVALPK